jgi:hypothetical protein
VDAKRVIAYFIHLVPGRPRDIDASHALVTIVESDVSYMLYTSFVPRVIRQHFQCASPGKSVICRVEATQICTGDYGCKCPVYWGRI